MTGTRSILAVAGALLLVSATAAAQDTLADELPETGTILEPGRYSNDFVGPTFEFEADEQWIVGPSGDGPIFTLFYRDAPGSVMSFTRFDGEAFLESCDPTSMTLVDPSVTRLAEIIAGNPYLNPDTPDAIEVDGFAGISLDVGVPAYTECRLDEVLIWAIPVGEGGQFVQTANQQSRFLILDVDDDVIVIAIESLPGVPFGGFLEAATELVESVRITPGEYVPPEPTPTPTPEPEEPTETEGAEAPSPAPGADASA